jgi:hypothetical protein
MTKFRAYSIILSISALGGLLLGSCNKPTSLSLVPDSTTTPLPSTTETAPLFTATPTNLVTSWNSSAVEGIAVRGSTLYSTNRIDSADGVLRAYDLSGTTSFGWAPVTTTDPIMAAVDPTSGNIFVGDGSTGMVSDVSPTSASVTAWNAANPNGIALDNSGNIYITNSSDWIVKYSNNGTPLNIWGPLGTGIMYGIAIYGSTIYVGTTDMKLWSYSSSGTTITSWPIANTGFAVAVDSYGDIYVAGAGSSTDYSVPAPVQKFSSTGTLLGQWGSFVAFGLAVDSDDNIYVPDFWQGKIFKFSSP